MQHSISIMEYEGSLCIFFSKVDPKQTISHCTFVSPAFGINTITHVFQCNPSVLLTNHFTFQEMSLV